MESPEDFWHDDTPKHQESPLAPSEIRVAKESRVLLRQFAEEFSQQDRFNGDQFFEVAFTPLWRDNPDVACAYHRLAWNVGERVADFTVLAILRTSFFIEPVLLPKVESTKFEVRWGNRLALDDPRRACYEDCLLLCCQLLIHASQTVVDPQHLLALQLFRANPLLGYELPVDYKDKTARPLHVLQNTRWFGGENLIKTLRLREFLLRESFDTELFGKIYDKVKVKAYLTDRATTGNHKTNREKRWEAHPDSTQFSFRQDCLAIEYTLISQLCHFKDFPKSLLHALQEKELIRIGAETARCPITLDCFHFDAFVRDVFSPVSGESEFHVGHLNPLKNATDGHVSDNVAWISRDGNRIQGKLTLVETESLLKRIFDNRQFRPR